MTNIPSEYETLFPYDVPRPAQEKGMNIIGDAGDNDGITVMEGACGTGKTLTALTPYLSRVRSDSCDEQRVFIVTSVKQQMEAFQDEIRRINDNLPDNVRPVSAITLVGISDLHPFVESGLIQDNKYSKIDSLREGARTLADEDIYDYSYQDLYHHAHDKNSKYAYSDNIPSLDGIEYDPYYAKYRAVFDTDDEEDIYDNLPFNPEFSGLLAVEDIREICAESGFCPHSIMRLSIEYVDVAIGNYMHVFDPKTVNRVTHPIINDETLAIFDEAHNLVPKVREFLSDSTNLTSIQKSIDEITEIMLFAKLSQYKEKDVEVAVNSLIQGNQTSSNVISNSEELEELIEEVLSNERTISANIGDIKKGRKICKKSLKEFRVSEDDLKYISSFYERIIDVVNDQVQDKLPISEDDSIRLRDPKKPKSDKISQWTNLSYQDNYNPMKKTHQVGEFVKYIRNELTEPTRTPKSSANSTGEVFTKWYSNDHTRYYRSIEIDERYNESSYGKFEWQRDYKAQLTIHNCIPKDEISDVLDEFSSSVLMSATLEPIDVYKKTTGINDLEDEGVNVYECNFGLEFPEKNRITLGVSADKFKYGNRGSPFNSYGANTDNDTREQYSDVIFDVVSEVNGNTLIVMPSYKEAEWVSSLLEQSYLCSNDRIFLDESSTNRETNELKNEFFEADNGVLITGARGTLIEGIDYIGDRLEAVVVCGVPITNTASDYKKAIETAYDEIFPSENGFNLAFTVPAVWKARQAMGRVIRTSDDVGCRILVDKRYVNPNEWDSVVGYLSPSEQDEIEYIPPEDLDLRLETFWNMHK